MIGVFLAFTLSAAIVSKTLEKIYVTDSTLLVALPADRASFDSVQASQAIARSYADIIESPNVAQLVSDRLSDRPDRQDILDATSFEPVEQTQLLRITVEDPDPERAKEIADAWADVVAQYARDRLQSTTGATVTVADRAPLPTAPDRPKPTLYTLVAAMLGLAIGLALAFLRDRLDRRLRTSEDVEERFDAPVLARIVRRGRSDHSVIGVPRGLPDPAHQPSVREPGRRGALDRGDVGTGGRGQDHDGRPARRRVRGDRTARDRRRGRPAPPGAPARADAGPRGAAAPGPQQLPGGSRRAGPGAVPHRPAERRDHARRARCRRARPRCSSRAAGAPPYASSTRRRTSS